MQNNAHTGKILVTGTAGFIGFHMIKALAGEGRQVIGLDNINDYYDVDLKYARLAESGIQASSLQYNRLVTSTVFPGYSFIKLDLDDRENLFNLFQQHSFDKVLNLAAQAGVRYSLTNPYAYLSSNLSGFLNILEACRHHQVKHLVYASSSSIYGLNTRMPFSVHYNADHPISLYAASKKSNELMAHTYSHLYGLPSTGLRFFTVYGPWGRPDMALYIFTRSIFEGRPIEVFNQGEMERDFTYIDDIVKGVNLVLDHPPEGMTNFDSDNPDPSGSPAPYRLYNIGKNQPVKLMDFIQAIEQATGKKAVKKMCPIQPGDVLKTWADVDDLVRDFNYAPKTSVKDGIYSFVTWFKSYYKIADI
jgi:UDP-glucuronate 4-epimerase